MKSKKLRYKKKSYSFGDFKKEKNGSGGPMASIFNFKIDKWLAQDLAQFNSNLGLYKAL
jgi:hypothetical protein